MRIGVLAGSVIPGDYMFNGEPVKNRSGLPSSHLREERIGGGTFLLLARHSMPPSIPPHEVNHRANIACLNEAGVDCIISICSSGALHRNIRVPSYAVPDDYVDLFSLATFHKDRICHITPSLSPEIRDGLIGGCKEARIDVTSGGIYVQTRGPRLETRAEVRLLSTWGDYVGMNMGPEATLARELDIPFGSLLTIDNYASGIMDDELDYKEILSGARGNWPDILRMLEGFPRALERYNEDDPDRPSPA